MPLTLIDEPMTTRLLAQGSTGGGGTTPAITVAFWVLALIAALVVGGFIVMALRRNLFAKDSAAGGAMGGGLMLDELRDLRRRGELTDEEYEVARDALTARLSGRPATVPTRRSSARGGEGALVAPPGFDLTGRPLPQTGGQGPPPHGPRTGPQAPGAGGGTNG